MKCITNAYPCIRADLLALSPELQIVATISCGPFRAHQLWFLSLLLQFSIDMSISKCSLSILSFCCTIALRAFSSSAILAWRPDNSSACLSIVFLYNCNVSSTAALSTWGEAGALKRSFSINLPLSLSSYLHSPDSATFWKLDGFFFNDFWIRSGRYC